jgi:hypothetical protein
MHPANPGASPEVVPKTHPAQREILPDDPLSLHACEVPGDSELMLRLLVEEYARMGWGTEALLGLARDPNYRALHGLWQALGEEAFRGRVEERLARCGIFRATTTHTEPLSQRLVPIAPLNQAQRRQSACPTKEGS